MSGFELILFDVDGTLIHLNGLHTYSFEKALQEIGCPGSSLSGYRLSGKTDPQIAIELMVLNGLEPSKAKDRLPAALETYASIALQSISEFELYPCAGIPDLLPIVSSMDSVTLGLLTGNLQKLVEPKLRAAALPSYVFSVGAYGSDNPDRNKLPDIAISQAEDFLQRTIQRQSVLIIGDTPKDIECARYSGTKVMAVATGAFSKQELSMHEPDFLLENLDNVEEVVAVLGCREHSCF